MEIIEIKQEKRIPSIPLCINQNRQPEPKTIKPTRKYIQPARIQSFAPKAAYCPAKNPIEAKTTYYLSYRNESRILDARPQPIKPVNNINLPEDKLPGDTTTKLSFPPVWGIYKAKPIVPRHRLRPQLGPMEKTTTIRQAFEPKYLPKAEMIVPCGQIRTGKGAFNTATTTLLSYMNPGPVEAVPNYKPMTRYCQPTQPTAKETTQKLSYPRYEISKKENPPWAQKPIYRSPDVAMPGETTYKKSYLECKERKKDTPILPKDEGVLPSGAEFYDDTVYRGSFVRRRPAEPVPQPFVPNPNIKMSNKKMTCVTTTELCYKPVRGERRKPIMPRYRKILDGGGYAMQSITTCRQEFIPKIALPPRMIVPAGQIGTEDSPLEDKTVTSLSFVKPGSVAQPQNFKPVLKYCKPDSKIEDETVSKMSYPKWSIGPKEKLPWAQKKSYEVPKETMPTTTIYHTSFPAPGYYVDEKPSGDSKPACTDN